MGNSMERMAEAAEPSATASANRAVKLERSHQLMMIADIQLWWKRECRLHLLCNLTRHARYHQHVLLRHQASLQAEVLLSVPMSWMQTRLQPQSSAR